ncbi:hypothetical protein C5167_021434 [Papaver somniferum]|uniref:protein FAF-like, chloroplastic n=1 Tax=Papaver somniferum TaxID=3469 RepID=UPI000E6F699E|nr:protein FAF-like, chloroplastic [Papaver somniferum]RZC94189.1 hypothetical protein C5167_021434 [Papaver somniferum]
MASVNQQVQGFGSILGFECEKTKYNTSNNSIRRTLSAVDMSSKKWLSSTQSEVSPLKKIASSDELQIAADQDIVEEKNDLSQQQQQPGQVDIWCSILTQKPSSLPPPYVHPLVKQSKSCLSLKSLEICTENLGSESGSDGYPHSDISLSDTEEEEEEEVAIEQVVAVDERSEVVKVDRYKVEAVNYVKKYSSPPSAARRFFPPPLKSLSNFPPPLKSLSNFPPPLKSLSKPGGGGIQMKTHRKDGRLILEAVSVPTSTNCFNAQRRGGRLVLTFASPMAESKSESEDIFETDEEVDLECSHDIETEEEEKENKGVVLEMAPKLPTGVIHVHRSALMVNKFTGLTNNRNNLTSCWSSSTTKLLPQSLPILAAGAPRLIPKQQTVAAAAAAVEPTFNRYEYCWRKETTSSMVPVSGIHHVLNQQQSLPNTKKTYNHRHHHNINNNLLTSKNNYYINNNNNNSKTIKGGHDYKEEKQINGNGEKVVEHLIVPAYCKPEPRRTLVFWEPRCIATS